MEYEDEGILRVITAVFFIFFIVALMVSQKGRLMAESKASERVISLPQPKVDGTMSIEKAIKKRRSVRDFKDQALTLEQLSQLLWAAQGITKNGGEKTSWGVLGSDGLRAAPSAGALYPLELYVVVGKTKDLLAGVYKYDCQKHALRKIKEGDKRKALSDACLGQDSVADGAVGIVITGVYERTSAKYGGRAERYVMLEAGHVSQNIYLQAASLGLGTVAVGAFDDEELKSVVGAQVDERPLYVMPLGVR